MKMPALIPLWDWFPNRDPQRIARQQPRTFPQDIILDIYI